MKKIKIILLIFIINPIFGQTENNNINVREPKIFDMLQKYDVPISGYTGTFDLNIPIYELNQDGFFDNIYLSYNSTGFFPNKRDGELGVNWSLNFGGVISRTVNGEPDDYMGHPEVSNTGTAHGNYYGGRRLPASIDQSTLDNNIFSLNLAYIYPVMKEFGGRVKVPSLGVSSSYEAKSDMFTFNFHGISGKFYFNSKGKPIVICNNNIKIDVDLTYFVETPSGSPYYYEPAAALNDDGTIYRSKIIFRLDNGYTYEFGGDLNSLSYNMSSPQNSSFSSVIPMGVNAWYLTKVISPNGYKLIYDYDHYKIDGEGSFATVPLTNPNTFEPPLFNANQYPVYPYLMNRYKNKSISFDQYYSSGTAFGIFPLWSSATSGSTNTQDQVNYTKGCYIRSIKSYSPTSLNSNINIYFYYTANTIKFYPTYTEYSNQLGRKLSQIKVYTTKHDLIKNYNLNYTTYQNRNFLTSINLNNEFYNQLDYYGLTQLPSTNTPKIDYWGFYNDNSSQNIIPQSIQDANGDFVYTSTEREPATNKFNIGMLQKITYKSKGFTEFIYEAHNYSKRLERRSVNNFLPALYQVEGITGGSRIQQIKHFDGISYTNVKSFVYTDGTNSSGILLDYPRYCMYIRHDQGNGFQYFTKFNSSGFNTNSIENNFITYSKVTEINSDNSKSEKYFTNYETNPDINDINTHELLFTEINDRGNSLPPFAFFPTFNLIELYKNYVGIQFNDQSIERGKLKKESFYDSNGNKVEEVEYKYNEDNNKYLEFIPNLKATGGRWIQSYKIYTYSNSLTERKVKKYFQNNIVQTIENKTYSNVQQIKLKSTTTSNSLGEVITTENFYPQDSEMATEPVVGDLISKNMIGIPLKKQVLKNGIKLSEEKTQYGNFPSSVIGQNLLLPQYIYAGKVNFIDKKITYDSYDTNGNIIQFTSENGISTTIIWGYNKTLPIAKIENATNNQVSSYIANLQSLSNTGTETQLIAALNSLRDSLPNAMVTTYTHLPLVGVSTITDPKGDAITYTYDSFNRLKEVKDRNGNKLSENEYHYKP